MVLKETKEVRVQQGREEWVEANKVCADIHHECWSSLELRRDTLRQNIARWVREIGEERGRIPMHLQVRRPPLYVIFSVWRDPYIHRNA
jgi:hypothetical protein